MATNINDYNYDYNDDHIFERRAVRGREPCNAVEDLAHRGRNPERFIAARLRLPVVKRNGRGHRGAKRRPITFPTPLLRYATTSLAELPGLLSLRPLALATLAFRSPRLALAPLAL